MSSTMEKSTKKSNFGIKTQNWIASWKDGASPPPVVEVEPEPAVPQQEKFKLSEKLSELKKPKCCTQFLKCLFTIVAVLTVLVSIGLIAVSITTAIATKVYDQEQSGRLVAFIMLAVTAAVTVAITTYALVAVFTKKNRPIHAASLVLVVLALVQAIIAGTSIKVTEKDQVHLARALTDSFRQAREHSPRHVKMWAATQNSLACCGMYGAEDYRPPNLPPYFPPDVPISCCPSYDADRSDLVQEREREQCKARREFYAPGCKFLVLEVYIASSILVLSVLIGLIILEIVLSVTGAILSRKQESNKSSDDSENDQQQVNGK